MPGSSDIALGNLQLIMMLQAALTPGEVETITTEEQPFTVNGLQVGDIVLVQKPTFQAGLGLAGARVTAANTLGITFVNPTAAGITPTAGEIYLILVFRRENPNGLPTAIV